MTGTKRRALVAFCMLFMAVLTFTGCEKSQDLEVGLLWSDDVHFTNNNSRYLGIIEGEFDQHTGFEATLMEVTEVAPGNNAIHKFSLSADSENYTAFVFVDENGNGTYDEGHDIVSGFKYNCADENGCITISVSSYY